MADLSVRIAELPDGARSAFAVLLIVVFGIKAALFPLFFWLPDSYPIAPSPITAGVNNCASESGAPPFSQSFIFDTCIPTS